MRRSNSGHIRTPHRTHQADVFDEAGSACAAAVEFAPAAHVSAQWARTQLRRVAAGGATYAKLPASPMLLASRSTKRLACYCAVAAPKAATTWCRIRQHVSSHLHLSSNVLAKCTPRPHALVASGIASAHDATTIAVQFALSRDALQVQHVDREACRAHHVHSVRVDMRGKPACGVHLRQAQCHCAQRR